MTLQEAYDLIDLLLDKADQPYFTNEEKNEFLNQAIMSFINNHYTTFDQEQVSRDALMYFVRNLPNKTDADFDWDSNSFRLPAEYVHIIHFRVSYAGADFVPAKILGTKDFWDLEFSKDPFNKPTETSPYCYVRHGVDVQAEVKFRPAAVTGEVDCVVLVFKDYSECFPTPNESLVSSVREIYQREIIDIAVRKMSGNIESEATQFQQIEAEQSKSI